MYAIRPYEEKDKKRVEAICLSTENPDVNGKRNMISKMMLTVFCHYYIEREPENCFVAVNEKDEAAGYILCAADFPTWERNFTELYLKKSLNPVTKAMGKGTIGGLKPYGADYPAHLHIDLAESCQRQGIGTRLVNTLLEHLRDNGVSGIMLSVAADNEKGLSFYKKCGFQELGRTKREITMGKKLSK